MVSSSDHMDEVIKVQRIPIGLLWDNMNWSHCYNYLFTILNGVIQPQKMDQKFEEVESYIQETCGRFLNGCI